jgi:GT2 family glycosyltransferase
MSAPGDVPGGPRDGAPGDAPGAARGASAPGFGCVVLSAGRSAADLARALGSLQAQRGVETDVVVVGNGWEPAGLPPGIRHVYIPDPVGIPAGRNAGVPHVRGELLFFLDDDASLAEPDALARVARELRGDVGALQLRVDPLGGGAPLREWVPRLRARDRTRSGDVTALWEGAVALPRAVFARVGGWPGEFRFVHEGVDLAWRVLDAGYRVRYAGDIAVRHPPAQATVRHGYSLYFGARNRVLLARRHLPLPLAVLYVASFLVRTAPRLASVKAAQAALRGYRDGLTLPTTRRPLHARTLWRMTRAGRPPIL